MNYPMKNGQIDPEFLEKVEKRIRKTNRSEFFDLEEALQAAEEVFAEMNESIKIGDQVRKSAEKDPWYYGQVVSVEGDTANVVWGLVSRPEPCKTNELVKTKEAQHGEG